MADIGDCPCFSMHKSCEITHVYGAEEAREVIRQSHADYLDKFGGLANKLAATFATADDD